MAIFERFPAHQAISGIKGYVDRLAQSLTAPLSPAAAIDPILSRRIDIARVICIFFVIYAHVPPYDYQLFLENSATPIAYGVIFLVEGVARASVPALSLISGFLTYGAITRGQAHSQLVSRRFVGLYVTAVAWSFVFLATYMVVSQVMGQPVGVLQRAVQADNPLLFWINALFHVTDRGIAAHLSFLRDLFVLILLSPFIARALHWNAAIVILAFGLLFAFDISTPITLRPGIAIMFVIGLWLRMVRFDVTLLDRWALPVIAVFLASTTLLTVLNASESLAQYAGVAIRVHRFLAAGAFWIASGFILSSMLATNALRLSPYLFLTYCAHPLLLAMIWPFWKRLIGTEADISYAVFFLGAAPLSFIVMITAALMMRKIMPRVLGILSGGRA